jgi:hypothetical protein
MHRRTILGVQIIDRLGFAPKVQELLTKYGCSIKTRLGLHEVSDDGEFCSRSGLLIMEMIGPDEEIEKLRAGLAELPGISVEKMVFETPELTTPK